ncbi:unnamed protein product [Vitrella brassicaformis CCMP3155]|uniref:Peptidase inhibitor I78 family protein n=1 Tax=Vitrella brassicaformis (strain CCMP3155) TaxID=1169540 RepID=A0A0G4GC51_VITBC|nr:unnamed protein product [Vitrella brassicaformis CCMP3155]|eukprot:CEM26426.1 unnamed protein product [Vitrella brassicaformis CCMP3155]
MHMHDEKLEQQLIGKMLKSGERPMDNTESNVVYDNELPTPNRVLGPEPCAVTMDYRPDRLNVHVDSDRIITKISWG